jgi:hypothetical protein
MKDAITKLTASKDLIGAVRCGIHEEVINIIDKDVRKDRIILFIFVA